MKHSMKRMVCLMLTLCLMAACLTGVVFARVPNYTSGQGVLFDFNNGGQYDVSGSIANSASDWTKGDHIGSLSITGIAALGVPFDASTATVNGYWVQHAISNPSYTLKATDVVDFRLYMDENTAGARPSMKYLSVTLWGRDSSGTEKQLKVVRFPWNSSYTNSFTKLTSPAIGSECAGYKLSKVRFSWDGDGSTAWQLPGSGAIDHIFIGPNPNAQASANITEYNKQIEHKGGENYRLYLDLKTNVKTYTSKPIDLLLVIDRSASMSEKIGGTNMTRSQMLGDFLKGHGGFVDRFLSMNTENRVGMVWFAYTPPYGNQANLFENTKGNNRLSNTCSDAAVGMDYVYKEDFFNYGGNTTGYLGTGPCSFTKNTWALEPNKREIGPIEGAATNYTAGLWRAIDMLRKSVTDAKHTYGEDGVNRVVLFISDGLPTMSVTTTKVTDINNQQCADWVHNQAKYTDHTATTSTVGNTKLWRFGSGYYSTGSFKGRKVVEDGIAAIENFRDYILNGHWALPDTTKVYALKYAFDLDGGTNGPPQATMQRWSNDVFNAFFAADSAGDKLSGKILTASDQSTLVSEMQKIQDDNSSIVDGVKYVRITDTLTEYVDFASSLNAKITKDSTVLYQNGAVTAAGQGIIQSVSTSGKTITATFNPDYYLDANAKYTLSFDVKTTQTAVDTFKSDGYNAIGDSGTDYGSNTTSSGKEGFYSNTKATVTFRNPNSGDRTVTYKKPVVQVQVTKPGNITLTVKKNWSGGSARPNINYTVYGTNDSGETVKTLATGTLTSSNGWSSEHTFSPDSPSGYSYSYSKIKVVETNTPSDYRASYSNNDLSVSSATGKSVTITITNTYEPQVLTLTVKKAWNNTTAYPNPTVNFAVFGVTSDNTETQLYSWKLSSPSYSHTHQFNRSELSSYVKFRVKETSTLAGYTYSGDQEFNKSDFSSDATKTITLTNTIKYPKLQVEKKWVDSLSSHDPVTYTIYGVKSDGTETVISSGTLSSNNSWKAVYTFTEANNIKDYKTIRVRENSVPTGYIVSYSADVTVTSLTPDVTKTITITNVRRPTTVVPDTIVLDYSKKIEKDILTNETEKNYNITLVGLTAYDSASDGTIKETNWNGSYASTLEGAKGTFTVSGNKIVYQLNDFLDCADRVLAILKLTNKTNSNMVYYAAESFTVLPATNVYYETDFVADTAGVFSFASNAGWTLNGTPDTNTQDDGTLGNGAKGDVYGYDSTYKSYSGYSNKSAWLAAGQGNTATTVSFTFKGTGFDLISRTGAEQGAIRITVTDANGNSEKILTVINKSETNLELNQIPVASIDNLSYGVHNVVIGVAAGNKNPSNPIFYMGNEFCFDAIRIYNPIDTSAGISSTGDSREAYNAYVTDQEANPQYFEMRDNLALADSKVFHFMAGAPESKTSNWLCKGNDEATYVAPAIHTGNPGTLWYSKAETRYVLKTSSAASSLFSGYTVQTGDVLEVSMKADVPSGTSLRIEASIEPTSGSVVNLGGTTVQTTKAATEQGWMKFTLTIPNALDGKNLKSMYLTIDSNGVTCKTGFAIDYIYLGPNHEDGSNIGFTTGFGFVDRHFQTSDSCANIAEYKAIGPKNEIYLAKNQSIIFKLSCTETPTGLDIGAKSADGKSVTMVTNIASAASGGTKMSRTESINTSTAMFYDLMNNNGEVSTLFSSGEVNTVYVTVTNTGEGILSLTDLKLTGAGVTKKSISVDAATRRFAASVLPAVEDEAQPESLSFQGKTVVLNDNYVMRFYVDQSLADSYDSVYIAAEKALYQADGTVSGTKSYRLERGELNEQYGAYAFDLDAISAYELGSAVKATVYGIKDGITYRGETVSDYSIVSYCIGQLRSTEDVKLKTLLVDILNYGAAAQTYFGYRTASPANAELTAEEQTLASTLKPLSTVKKHTQIDAPTVAIQGCAMILGSRIGMRFVFDPGEYLKNGALSDLTVVWKDAKGETLAAFGADEFQSGAKGEYSVVYSGLGALRMRDTITIAVYAGGEQVSNTVTYSVESYAYSMQASKNAALIELVNRMLQYGDSARAWKSEN